MSEAIHEVAHEATHDAAHNGRGHAKKIGLLISILALCLAVSEMMGKSAQTHGLALNIEASDTWNFFQAKTIRQTVLRTALDSAKLASPVPGPEAQKQLAAWQADIERYETDPAKGEGRKELMAKAKAIEHHRDVELGRYHAFEIASLILQLGIVLASVSLLSSLTGFAIASGVLGLGGLFVLVSAWNNIPAIMQFLH